MGESVRLGELISITRGTTYKSALLGQDGPVLLGLASIARNGGFRSDNLKTYGGDSPEKLLVRPGQIFASLKDVTQTADLLGSVARVPKDGPVGRLTQDTVRLDPISDAIDPAFLYLSLLTPQYRAFCRAHGTGTTTLGLPRDDFLGYKIRLPPLTEQRRIAGVVGAIDNLIDHNRGLAKSLIELGVVLGSSFSGDRRPVREVASVNRGVSYTGRGLAENGASGALPMINLANFSAGPWWKPGGMKFYTGEHKRHHVLDATDLVLANTDLTQRREVLGRGLMVAPHLAGAIHSHHTSRVVFDHGSEHLRFVLWAQLQSSTFRERAKGFATGTTVTALPKEAVLDFEMLIPSDPRASVPVEAIVRQVWALEAEIDDLKQAHDELLPLLVSGQVRVRDVEGVA